MLPLRRTLATCSLTHTRQRLLRASRVLPAGAQAISAHRPLTGRLPMQSRQYSHAARRTIDHSKPPHRHVSEPPTTPSFITSLAHTGVLPSVGIERNASAAHLYACALRYEQGTVISSAGALVARSGKKTGRSPKDKRVVEETSTVNDVWWGPVNKKLSEESFAVNHQTAMDYLNTRDRLYVFDG
ncbi:Protein kinase C-like 1, partial [Coemansia sp. RSA 2703]